MKFSKFVFAALVVASGAAFAADEQPKKKLTPAERRALEAKFIADMGGEVFVPATGDVIRVINAQKTVSADVVKDFVKEFKGWYEAGPEYVEMEPGDPLDLVKKGYEIPKTGSVVLLVESDRVPALMIAPEEGFSIVNVTPLKKDNPDAEKLTARVMKELWRGSSWALGAANSNMVPCVLEQVNSLQDLDEVGCKKPGPEPYNKLRMTLEKYGIQRPKKSLYRIACQQGWAPAPTNDVQRKIWKEVHELPSNPMKIKFDKAKGE